MAEVPASTAISEPNSTVAPPETPSLNEALGALQSELLRLKSAAEQIDQSKEAAREAVGSAKQVGEAAVALAAPTQTLVERLDKVDFPSRLDKLDATVSALQAGFQTVQGRLDGVERNLKDDLRGVQAEIGRVGQTVEAKAAEAERKASKYAAGQARATKQLRLLLFTTLVGLVALLALALLPLLR